MGVLAPIFLAGLTALSLPLIFHLVRRTPQGRQDFSSLIFLAPTPPRLTRRSRLDQLLLLLLRLAALGLIIFAFARPFLRKAASLTLGDLPSRRVALLIDESASMRRGDVWTKAIKAANEAVSDLNAHDEVALFTFGEQIKTVVPFGGTPFGGTESDEGDKRQIIKQTLGGLRPTWSATDLGQALVAVSQELDSTTDVKQLTGQPEIVLISDFQLGASLDALQGYEWPKRIHVIPRMIAPSRATNAFVRILLNDEDRDSREVRVRVVNAANSASDQFSIGWLSPKPQAEQERNLPVYVPAGQSRVVRMARNERQLDADRIVLHGDDHEFDNMFYVVPLSKLPVKIDYLGDDRVDDPQGTQYYLRLALADDPLRQVEIRQMNSGDWSPGSSDSPQTTIKSRKTTHLVVATTSLSGSVVDQLQTFVQQGGTLVLVPRDVDAARTVMTFLDDVKASPAATNERDFHLLGEIDFSHPLFSALASPRYSDFTKIRFWKDRGLTLSEAPLSRAIAKFDNGVAAIIDRKVGAGRILAFGSGWNPEESQLALSSKFVAIAAGLLDYAGAVVPNSTGYTVNQSISLEGMETPCTVTVPDGRQIAIDDGVKSFSDTRAPGTYRIRAGEYESHVAVNLAPVESNTAPMNMEQLDQLGVKIGAGETRAERMERVRQLRDVELERQQKAWRWLLVGAIAVLILETGLAGRATRKARENLENQS